MTNYQNLTTIHDKWLAGYNLLWNSHTHEVHMTEAFGKASHHIDRITASHEHFFSGSYEWGDATNWWVLCVHKWDPATDPHRPPDHPLPYSNCAFCQPELHVLRHQKRLTVD